MDIDATNFPVCLTGLLMHIAEADFVAFDLELSGIPSRLPNRQPRPGGGRFSLEERYAETKEGAERYQILQVGITCGRFDYLQNTYVLQPYNIYISPLLDEKLDIEREVSFQSGAVSFLLEHDFDMAKPFTSGVQYLSREEAAYAKRKAWDRLEKKNPPADMQLTEADVDSLDYMRRIRAAIDKWKASSSSSLEITTHTGLRTQPASSTITRFEKRLVHQLVRAEYPGLVSIGRSDCVKIIHHDAMREAENTRRMKQRVTEQISRQIGFRWIFEALVGGNLSGINPIQLAHDRGVVFGVDMHELKARCDRSIERLKTRQPVLVGHNMFTDIVYIYRTFFGPLPDTLQEFNEAIHELFPKIIDTKYLATFAGGDLNYSPTLQEIAEGLSTQRLPRIVTSEHHNKYQHTEAFHEAGYDSLLTATIMLQLAAKVNAERIEQGGSSDPGAGIAKIVERPDSATDDFVRDGREKIDSPVPLPPTIQKSASRFQTKNIFDDLQTMSLDDTTDDPAQNGKSNSTSTTAQTSTNSLAGHPTASCSWEDDEYVQDTTGWVPIQQMTREDMELIPPFDSPFWKDFGNTLRVFGTQEAMLKIADW